jgi:hypothetical protein
VTDLGEPHLAHLGVDKPGGQPVVRVTRNGSRPLTEAEFDRYLADWKIWKRATTLRRLANLMAAWFEGTCTFQPAYNASNPNLETEPLLLHLIRANRAGFFTESSQPGLDGHRGHDGAVRHQRAFVSGWAEAGVTDDLARAFGDDERFIFVVQSEPVPPLRCNDAVTPVTVRERGDGTDRRDVVTVAGTFLGKDYLRAIYQHELRPAAIKAICDAYQVTIIDTEFGGRMRLWEKLDRVLAPRVPRAWRAVVPLRPDPGAASGTP